MKMHVGLGTKNLSESITFYRDLLGTEPAKRHDDYAKFEPPTVGLVLSLLPAVEVPVVSGPQHFGLRVDSIDEVSAIAARLKKAGQSVRWEKATECCYAMQDKVWTSDPDGNPWEVYVVTEQSEVMTPPDKSCCA